MHGKGSLGTNVLCTIAGRLLCWTDNGPHISRIATAIRTALILRLLRRYFGIAAALLRQLFTYTDARVSRGSWPENTTLTPIRTPNRGLASDRVASPTS